MTPGSPPCEEDLPEHRVEEREPEVQGQADGVHSLDARIGKGPPLQDDGPLCAGRVSVSYPPATSGDTKLGTESWQVIAVLPRSTGASNRDTYQSDSS